MGQLINWYTHPPLWGQMDYNTKVINKGDCMIFTSDRPVKELNDFVDYVWSFYGEHDDTLYPITGLTKRDIYNAFSSIKRELRGVIRMRCMVMHITHGVMEIVLIERG